MMGLEYKCPSLHYHSHERLIALCLPFYEYSLPSCFVWFWAWDSDGVFDTIWGTLAVLWRSLTSAWFRCLEVTLWVGSSPAVGLHSYSGEEMPLSNSALECLHLHGRSHLTLYRQVYSVKTINCHGLLCHSDCIVATISVMYHCNCCLFTLCEI